MLAEMKFDHTMNFNVLITVGTMLVGGGALYAANNAGIVAANKRIDVVETTASLFRDEIKKNIERAGDRFDDDHERLVRIEEITKAIAETLKRQPGQR